LIRSLDRRLTALEDRVLLGAGAADKRATAGCVVIYAAGDPLPARPPGDGPVLWIPDNGRNPPAPAAPNTP
jgi:hypothetical protein